MSFQRIAASSLLSLLLSALALAATPAMAAPYVDATSYLVSDEDYEAWYTLRAGLEHDFDNICGDTFCGGDYSNIQALRYECSVDEASGRIGMCMWTFAASNEQIEAGTGHIRVATKDWRCRTPLAPGITIEELLIALHGDEPLHAPLPATNQSIYDGLVRCL